VLARLLDVSCIRVEAVNEIAFVGMQCRCELSVAAADVNDQAPVQIAGL